MTDTGIERSEPTQSDPVPVRLVLAISTPIALTLLAYGMGWASNQSSGIGPFDRAALGWVVVAPLWLSSPIVAGFLWRPLGGRQTRVAAATVVAVVGGAAALLYWQWIGTPFDCGFGTVTPALAFLPPTLIVGLSVGAGLALSSLLSTTLVRAGVHWWWVAVVVGGSEVVLLAISIFLGFAALGGHICYVPGPNYPVGP
jgi:hypothetical protein